MVGEVRLVDRVTPEDRQAIGLERRVRRHQDQILEVSLGDQHTIERIVMVSGQSTGVMRMLGGHR